MPCQNCICDCEKKAKRELRLSGKKECHKCNEIKDIELFDKKRAECKECRKGRNTKYYNEKVKKKNETKKKKELIKKVIMIDELKDIKEILMTKAETII